MSDGGPCCLLTLSALSYQYLALLYTAGLLEGTVFNLKCLSANQCPSDGVCHQPEDDMYLSWVSSCGCVFLRCVQQANACRGESLRKERDTLNCQGTSMFYNHVSDDHVDLSALLNKDVPRSRIFAHRPPLRGLKPKQRIHTNSRIPNGNVVVGSRGSPQSHVKSS